eukprot:TRINITY_DN3625_c0_g1_i1.p1 TRINITY_DN3625_c0_g1~~TRINITY_DN3625_c0_g1_i1.p1  ORF type:complete len:1179 (-),score=173.74 TRINITY_DN3625_c0_g1_i1:31-3567(-)
MSSQITIQEKSAWYSLEEEGDTEIVASNHLSLGKTATSQYIIKLEEVCVLSKALVTNRSLTKLSLAHCNLGTQGLLALGFAFCGPLCNQTLQELNLENCGLSAKALSQFTEMLHQNISLVSCRTEEKKDTVCLIKGLKGAATEREGEETDSGREAKLWKKARECLHETILVPNRTNYLTLSKDHQSPQNPSALILSGRYAMLPDYRGQVLSFFQPFLRVLKLAHTQLMKVPKEVTQMWCLEELDVSHNPLVNLDNISQIRSLKKLNLSATGISEIPKFIALLSHLEELKCENNQIQQLCMGLSQLPSLSSLYLMGNPLESEDPDIIAKLGNPVEVVREIKNLYAEAGTRLNVMLVGDENVGKTSLLQSLKLLVNNPKLAKRKEKGKVVRPKHNVATDGIELHSINVKEEDVGEANATGGGTGPGLFKKRVSSSKKIQFNFWDFAGQQTYYVTHQFFFHSQSVYLCICDMTKLDRKSLSRVDHWLHLLNLRAKNAPVFIIGTHRDLLPKKQLDPCEEFRQIMEQRCASKFKSVAGYFTVSSHNMAGVRELLVAIAKLSKTHNKVLGLTKTIPSTFLHLEEIAKALRSTYKIPVISWAEWAKKAEEYCNIADPQDLRDATKCLHKFGAIVWFHSDKANAENLVILDPMWLIDVFKSVVTAINDETYAGASPSIKQGVLLPSDFVNVWRAPRFQQEHFPFLLSILEKFEVLHPLEEGAVVNYLRDEEGKESLLDPSEVSNFSNTKRFIVPCLLQTERPSDSELGKIWPDDGSIEIERRFKFEFLPDGFFSRLMVRLLHSKWRALLFWRYGIIMYRDKKMLRIETDTIDNELIVYIRGTPSRMGCLLEGIYTLVSDWMKGVVPSVEIACVSCSVRCTNEKYFFPMSLLESSLKSRQRNVHCPICVSDVRIDALAPDLTMSELHECEIFEFSELHILEELGVGGFATVSRGVLPDGTGVAIKKITEDQLRVRQNPAVLSEYEAEFRREVWLMSGMDHPNILKLLGICTTPLCMILELASGGDLHAWVNSTNNVPTEENFWLREELARDIALGMEFLHSMSPPIIHRDLKSPNVLLVMDPLKARLVAKIADFGLSRGLAWSATLEGKVVDNPTWLAPEILMNLPYTEKVDVYSFGVIVWELSSGKVFFEGVSWFSTIEDMVLEGMLSFVFSQNQYFNSSSKPRF